MDKTKSQALRAYAKEVRFQFFPRESIASAIELLAAQLEKEEPQSTIGAEQVAEMGARLDKLEALLDQLKPPFENVAEAVQTGADTNVGA